MRNVILNITATGSWQRLDTTVGFPRHAYTVTIQPRTAADALFRYRGQTNYMTIKSGGSARLEGQFDPDDLEVQATGGVILEVECSTNPRDLGR